MKLLPTSHPRTLYPTSDKSSYLTSSANGSSPTKTRYNTIGSGSWTQSTQTVTWEFNVDKAGYYKIRYKRQTGSDERYVLQTDVFMSMVKYLA